MENQNKDGDSGSRESYGLKISELLKALAERKSPPCGTTRIDPRNISATLSILRNTGSSDACGTFRSRAALPENISRLSRCHLKRRDHLSESLSASVPAPVAAGASSEEEQPSLLPSSSPVVLAHLVERSKVLPSGSSTRERLKKGEIHPHILGVQAWAKQQSCEPRWTLPKQLPQSGPTTEWFFEDLTDLQKKLFLGASKKHGVLNRSPTAQKTARLN